MTEFTREVILKSDEHGFFERACPSCENSFQICLESDSSKSIEVSSINIWCPYCGHHDNCFDFHTREQMAYIDACAEEEALKFMEGEIDKIFSSGLKGSGFSITTQSSSQVRPKPLPPEPTDQMKKQARCNQCQTQYKIKQVSSYCPGCGKQQSIELNEVLINE